MRTNLIASIHADLPDYSAATLRLHAPLFTSTFARQPHSENRPNKSAASSYATGLPAAEKKFL